MGCQNTCDSYTNIVERSKNNLAILARHQNRLIANKGEKKVSLPNAETDIIS